MSCGASASDAFPRREAAPDARNAVRSGEELSIAAAAGLPRIGSKRNLSDQLVDALKQAIVLGHLKPGDHIKEKDIAAPHAVSRVPVREALRSLEADGWIVIRPRRGAFVQEHSAAELISLHEMRTIVEPSIVGLAAQRRTPAQLELLREIVARGRGVAQRGTAADAAFNNREFHTACAVCACNDHAVRVVANLEQRLQCYLSSSPELRAGNAAVDHEAIFRAIEMRDGAAASAAMAEHLCSAGRLAAQRPRTRHIAKGTGATKSCEPLPAECGAMASYPPL